MQSKAVNMSENQYILLTINNSHERIKVYIYNEGDFLNWISRYTFYVEPGHESLYQNNGPYKYQVRSNKLNDVVLLKRNIKLTVDSTGCVNTYLLCDEKLKETNQAIAICTAKEDETNNNVDYFKVLGLERTITKSEEVVMTISTERIEEKESKEMLVLTLLINRFFV